MQGVVAIKPINLCLGCMEEKDTGNICSYCGFSEDEEPESLLHLLPGTILNGKYLIGRAIGQGGFGITYLAWDLTLNVKLAIKEYLPQQLATRAVGKNAVTVIKKTFMEELKYGLTKFLEEAQTLARFMEHPNIVSVRDFFKANGTAYLVMNYHEGVTLLSYLQSRGGRITVEQAINIFMPVLDALKEVHNSDILHRDISPDNLLINTMGRVILIDFGAARQAMGERSKSLSVMMKVGYSPPEQYQSKGKQGPWTDIYAVAATMYRCITGQPPLEAIDRMAEDTLIAPSQLNVDISPEQERIILKALSVKAAHRYQTIEDFQLSLIDSHHKSDTAPPLKTRIEVDLNYDEGYSRNNNETGQTPSPEIRPANLTAKYPWTQMILAAAIFLFFAAAFYGGYYFISAYFASDKPADSPIIMQARGNSAGNIANGGLAAEHEGWIYYRSNDSGKIYRISTDGTNNEKVNDDDSWYINVAGNWIYYRTQEEGRNIYRIRTDGSERERITEDNTWYVNVVGDWVYYRNQDDGDKAYRISLSGDNQERILDDSAGWKNVSGEHIYYVNIKDSGRIYRASIEGGEQKRINHDRSDWLNVVGEWIYYRNLDDNGTIYRIDTDGKNRTKINNAQSSYINVHDNRIYYTNIDDNNSMYSIGTDGKGHLKINDTPSSHLNLVGDWIYYRNWADYGKQYRIRTDGTNAGQVK